MSIYNLFVKPSGAGDAWFFTGLTTSYPNITASSSSSISDLLPCKDSVAPGCKIFHVPTTDSSKSEEVHLQTVTDTSAELGNQVLIFQYEGQFHAVDHRCPHSSFPLSRGILFDIEDFGIRLSAGIRCPKHDWSFDLIRGNGDRGNYRLNVWEVQLRPVAGGTDKSESNSEGKESEVEREVWVRRKQRIG